MAASRRNAATNAPRTTPRSGSLRSSGSRRPGGAPTERESLCVLVKAGVALSRAEGGPQNDWSAVAVPPTSAPTMDAPVVRLIDGNRQLDALLGGSDRHRADRWDAMGRIGQGHNHGMGGADCPLRSWRGAIAQRSRSPSGANRSVGQDRSGTAGAVARPGRPATDAGSRS
jgi:hypothetical protein